MTRLPRGVSSRRVVAALKRAGFFVRRQKGSHIVMRRDEPFAQVVVPAHSPWGAKSPASSSMSWELRPSARPSAQFCAYGGRMLRCFA